jgi:hypothetical protein
VIQVICNRFRSVERYHGRDSRHADIQDFAVDSEQISIDGQLVAHHIYRFKELEAFAKGGVQRIYTGSG